MFLIPIFLWVVLFFSGCREPKQPASEPIPVRVSVKFIVEIDDVYITNNSKPTPRPPIPPAWTHIFVKIETGPFVTPDGSREQLDKKIQSYSDKTNTFVQSCCSGVEIRLKAIIEGHRTGQKDIGSVILTDAPEQVIWITLDKDGSRIKHFN